MNGDAAILEARARRLARRPAAAQPDDQFDVATFTASGQTYAVEARRVVGVQSVGDISPLPGGGDAVRGLMLARGALACGAFSGAFATLLDLPRLLGRSGGETPRFALLLDAPGLTAALGADEIGEVMPVSARALAPSPALPSVRGQLTLADRRILLLDVDVLIGTYLGSSHRSATTP